MAGIPSRRLSTLIGCMTLVVMSPVSLVSAPPAAAAPVPTVVTRTAPLAGAAEYRYEVEVTAAGIHEIPGLSVTFDAIAGAPTHLQALNLATANVTPLVSGENIGNTFRGTCRYANGAELSGVRGAYWASNLVPPGETSVTPNLRWLFIAPETGTYTCVVSIASYSTIIGRNGRTVTMRIPAGASLARSTVAAGATWLVPSTEARTVAAGGTTTVLSYTYATRIAAATRIRLNADIALSTCKYLSSLCPGGVKTVVGTTARTWIEVQPLNAAGLSCGPLRTSPAVTAWISTPKHHLTMNNQLKLDKITLGACTALSISVKVRAVDGNPLYIHGGTASGSAASHAMAYEY